jgi:hypothetical protein
MKNRVYAFAIPAVILLAVFLVPSLLTNQSSVTNKPSKEDVLHKMQRIQIPFIANDGQVDEQVDFYAKTFGGTVFVTKEGEIVYALPWSRPEDASSQLKVGSSECRGELHSPSGISPLKRGEEWGCPERRCFSSPLAGEG